MPIFKKVVQTFLPRTQDPNPRDETDEPDALSPDEQAAAIADAEREIAALQAAADREAEEAQAAAEEAELAAEDAEQAAAFAAAKAQDAEAAAEAREAAHIAMQAAEQEAIQAMARASQAAQDATQATAIANQLEIQAEEAQAVDEAAEAADDAEREAWEEWEVARSEAQELKDRYMQWLEHPSAYPKPDMAAVARSEAAFSLAETKVRIAQTANRQAQEMAAQSSASELTEAAEEAAREAETAARVAEQAAQEAAEEAEAADEAAEAAQAAQEAAEAAEEAAEAAAHLAETEAEEAAEEAAEAAEEVAEADEAQAAADAAEAAARAAAAEALGEEPPDPRGDLLIGGTTDSDDDEDDSGETSEGEGSSDWPDSIEGEVQPRGAGDVPDLSLTLEQAATVDTLQDRIKAEPDPSGGGAPPGSGGGPTGGREVIDGPEIATTVGIESPSVDIGPPDRVGDEVNIYGTDPTQPSADTGVGPDSRSSYVPTFSGPDQTVMENIEGQSQSVAGAVEGLKEAQAMVSAQQEALEKASEIGSKPGEAAERPSSKPSGSLTKVAAAGEGGGPGEPLVGAGTQEPFVVGPPADGSVPLVGDVRDDSVHLQVEDTVEEEGVDLHAPNLIKYGLEPDMIDPSGLAPPEVDIAPRPTDSDSDGLSDSEEGVLGEAAFLAAVNEGHAAIWAANALASVDTEEDGVTDGFEVEFTDTDPASPHTVQDGPTIDERLRRDRDLFGSEIDLDDIAQTVTDPLASDTDQDGHTDFREKRLDGTGPTTPDAPHEDIATADFAGGAPVVEPVVDTDAEPTIEPPLAGGKPDPGPARGVVPSAGADLRSLEPEGPDADIEETIHRGESLGYLGDTTEEPGPLDPGHAPLGAEAEATLEAATVDVSVGEIAPEPGIPDTSKGEWLGLLTGSPSVLVVPTAVEPPLVEEPVEPTSEELVAATSEPVEHSLERVDERPPPMTLEQAVATVDARDLAVEPLLEPDPTIAEPLEDIGRNLVDLPDIGADAIDEIGLEDIGDTTDIEDDLDPED